MPLTPAVTLDLQSELTPALQAVAEAVRLGLSVTPKTLPPWLFYDKTGSELFEKITELPEYYLTRTERALFADHANQILRLVGETLTVVELGAGTATKTGLLLDALARLQPAVLYQPVDISPAALDHARTLERSIPGVAVRPQVANYVTDPFFIERVPGTRVLALYIGSSIGNFSPWEARAILRNLRDRLVASDGLLLGTDLAPSAVKPVETLLAAYNDAAGVTAAFNRNMLHRLNRELGADLHPDRFAHRAIWNPAHSRIEMHLQSTCAQLVRIPAHTTGDRIQPELTVRFVAGETIHTENSYKFTAEAIASLLTDSGFAAEASFEDANKLFAVTLARAL